MSVPLSRTFSPVLVRHADPATLHRAGEGQPDAEEAVARAVLDGVAWGTGGRGLMDLARLILLTHYPEDVFTGRRRNPHADPGVQLVQALRACDDALGLP